MPTVPGSTALTDLDALAGRLAVALAIGLLVGLERGWRERDEAEGSRTAGIRTFGLAGLLGGLSAALAGAMGGEAMLPAAFLGYTAVFAAFKYREATHDDEFSVTTVVAALAVFVLGALAVAGDYRLAAASGAVVAALLISRAAMHGILRGMTWIELRSAILLAAMTMIGLPLLPDRPVDPWGGLNPWEIWFLTVLTASISFVGYVAVRVMGTSRGLVVSGLAGGLVSSTATIAALGRSARDGRMLVPRAAAAMLACLVSLVRVAALVVIVAPAVLPTISAAFVPAALVLAVAAAAILARTRDNEPADSAHGNPFDLLPLLAFAAFLAVVSVLGAVLFARFGDASIVVTSALSGLVDLDVASLSALRQVETGADPRLAGMAILAAVAANTVVRITLAIALGPRGFSGPFSLVALVATGTGVAGLLLAGGAVG